MFGTYQRLRLPISASNVAVIRAVRRKFTKASRRDPAMREGRKHVYRAMLDYHAKARGLARQFRL